MLTIKLPQTAGKVLRFLDKPALWILYFIIAMYLFFAGLSVLRGIVKYNHVLDKIEAKALSNEAEINNELSKSGFKITWGNSPKLIDYLYAGL